MKTRLNILCTLVIVVLILSSAESINAFFMGARSGFTSAETDKKEELITVLNAGPVCLLPKSFQGTNIAIHNQKTNSEVKLWPIEAMVSVDKERSMLLSLFAQLINIGTLIFTICAIVQFIKLIRRIDKKDVFSHSNVKRLRKLGWILIGAYLCNAIYFLIELYGISQVLEVQGYSLNYWRIFSSLSLLLGIISFVVAEIFTIGLRTKEEQELTI